MEILEIVGESLGYSFSDEKKLLKVGLLALLPIIIIVILYFLYFGSIMSLSSYSYYSSSNAGFGVLGIVLGLLILVFALVLAVILQGCSIEVMREGVNRSGIVPDFQIGEIVIDGIKALILTFLYNIIPGVIAIIAAVLLLIGGSSHNSSFTGVMVIIAALIGLIAGILSLIVQFMLPFGLARFADGDSISDGLRITEVIADLREYGIAKWYLTYAVIFIVGALISLLGLLTLAIPFSGVLGSVGGIIGVPILLIAYLLFFVPLSIFFESYAFGLAYSNVA